MQLRLLLRMCQRCLARCKGEGWTSDTTDEDACGRRRTRTPRACVHSIVVVAVVTSGHKFLAKSRKHVRHKKDGETSHKARRRGGEGDFNSAPFRRAPFGGRYYIVHYLPCYCGSLIYERTACTVRVRFCESQNRQ